MRATTAILIGLMMAACTATPAAPPSPPSSGLAQLDVTRLAPGEAILDQMIADLMLAEAKLGAVEGRLRDALKPGVTVWVGTRRVEDVQAWMRAHIENVHAARVAIFLIQQRFKSARRDGVLIELPPGVILSP